MRRVDSFRERVAVFRRLVCAVGQLQYGDRCRPMFNEFALVEDEFLRYSRVFLFNSGRRQMTLWPCGSRSWRDIEAKKRRANFLPDAVYYLLPRLAGPKPKWRHHTGGAYVDLDYPDENLQIQAFR